MNIQGQLGELGRSVCVGEGGGEALNLRIWPGFN